MSVTAYTQHNANLPPVTVTPSRVYPQYAQLYAVTDEPLERMQDRIRAHIESQRNTKS